MKQSDALVQMRLYLLTLQKCRSAVAEELPHIPQETLAKINKWVYGENAEPLMNALVTVIDNDSMTAMQYYNFRTILWRWTPEIIFAAMVLRLNPDGIELPDGPPEISLMIDGWSDE